MSFKKKKGEKISIGLLKNKGFPCSSSGNESTYNAGDPSLIPRSGRSPRKDIVYPLQYSGLENSVDCIVMESQRAGHFDFHFHLKRK